MKGDYSHAISIYQALEQQGVKRSELYCNTGNAFYKAGKAGWAVYYYEKGLKNSPLDTQLVINRRIALANDAVADTPSDFSPILGLAFVLRIADAVAAIAVLGILVSSILFLASIFPRLKSNKEKLATWCRDSLLVSSISLLIAGGVQFYFERTEAIIVQPQATVRVGPSIAARKLFEAKAGDKVEVQSRFSGWLKVKAQSGEVGWVPATSAGELDL